MCYDIVILVLIWVILFRLLRTEKFADLFNIPTRSTRNMSYDLRCETPIQQKEYTWLNPSIIPNQQIKCLDLQ